MIFNHKVQILMADDDPDDRLLMKEALRENKFNNPLSFVENGEDMLNYLHQKEKYIDALCIRPSLILLDLNMPKVDVWEALWQMRLFPTLKYIPAIIITTSSSEGDILRSYNLKSQLVYHQTS